MARQARATAVGACAIILWSLLAVLTTGASGLPPFQLLALTFAVGAAVNGALAIAGGRAARRRWRQPWPVWALGIGGLFFYHAFYFVALSHAPPAAASLIAYLWPVLIVVMAGLLPGERLRLRHLLGGGLGLVGAGLLITDGGQATMRPDAALGYGAALACALTWSGYSVLNRRFGAAPSLLVGPFCGAVAVLGLLCHGAFEAWVAPGRGAWLAILGLGLGPVGLAFLAWDYGTKHGDLQLLGVLSYGAPLLSTLLLVVLGRADGGPVLLGACLLIVGGAVVAAGLFSRAGAERTGESAASPPPTAGD